MNELQTASGIIEKCHTLSIGILGDFCLDVYFSINMEKSEISVETDLPTYPVQKAAAYPGGAGNVAMNLLDIGVRRVVLFGLVGSDMYGRELVQILRQKGADCSRLITQEEDWHTHVYTKIIKEGREANRLDFGNFNRIQEEKENELMQALSREMSGIDVLLINQQQINGIHSASFRKKMIKLIGSLHDTPVLLDSRNYADEFTGTIRKLNEKEARSVLRYHNIDPAEAGSMTSAELAEHLYDIWGKPVFLTLGENGCLVFSSGKAERIWGLHFIRKLDPVGAGDSFFAGIGTAVGSGYGPADAALFGNLTAGVTIQKLNHTGTAKPAEILALAESPDYRYHPEKAASHRNAEYIENSDIEFIIRPPNHPGFKYAIFDHDGTISTIRQGWEDIMKPMMIRAVAGTAGKTMPEETLLRIEEAVQEFIDKTTGVQTLVQMNGLTELVREFGFVPEDEIKDAAGYKEVYNRDLIEMVRKRIDLFTGNRRSLEDFTIKNAVPFLEALRNRGITLYLASGTDEKDVQREAEILGYSGLFNGGICGAVGRMDIEPKKIVLQRIIGEIGRRNAARIITFGDGPVELRETKKTGGFCVGLASDEIRRHGLNPEKRSRLILAGADIVIPDFSRIDQILELLFK